MTCGLADDVYTVAFVDYAPMKVASLNDDFHGGVLGINERG